MATVDPLRYRTNGDDPEDPIDPDLLAQVMDTLDYAAAGDTTRISRAPMRFHNIAEKGARQRAINYIHDRHIDDRDNVIYASFDPEFERMLLQANPEITITHEQKNDPRLPDEIDRDVYGGEMYREYSTTFPTEIEGIGTPNPSVARGVPDRTLEELMAMSPEDRRNEDLRNLAGENVIQAILQMELGAEMAGDPLRRTTMPEAKELLRRADMLPDSLGAQTDSILSEMERGEGKIRRTPGLEAILRLIERRREEAKEAERREFFGGIAGLRRR